MNAYAQNVISRLLSEAGITVNGSGAADPVIHDDRFYKRVISGGSLALGESYTEGWWDVQQPDLFFEKILEARLYKKASIPLKVALAALWYRVTNKQKIGTASENIQHHYDKGLNLFKHMLDKQLVYSCGYWEKADSLDDAQTAKLDLICRKLDLKPGMTFLDIGCGWGSLVKYAAINYGVEATGITISPDQYDYATESCSGLNVKILLCDYRKLNDQFDRIASVGMVEHVGYKNYPVFMESVKRCLNKGGLFLLHTIGNNQSGKSTDPWINKYIFPNSLIPSLSQLSKAAESYFIPEDLHNFGSDYDRTLMSWDENFRKNWPKLKATYNDQFYRMWRYYLTSCAAAFRVRQLQLWQIMYSDGERKGKLYVCR